MFEHRRVLIGAILFLHALGLISLYDPLPGLYDINPIIKQDWGLHFHHLKSLEAFWQKDKTFWGYNPYFMAGYPSNTIQDLSIKLFEFVALTLSFFALEPIQWFKLSVFLATSSIPWMLYLTARNLFEEEGIKNVASIAAALLGTIYWWNSLPREMFFYGMIGYSTAAYASLLGVSLFYRIAKQQTSWGAVPIGWLLFVFAILPLHIQSLIIFLPAVIGLLSARPKLLQRNLLLWTIGAATVSLAVNMVWLAPAFDHRGDDVSAAIVEQLSLFVSADPFTFLKDYLTPRGYSSFRTNAWEKGLRLMLLVFGVMAILQLLRQQKEFGALLAAAVITLFFITYFGSFIPFMKGWQPLRFKVPYDLFLVIASSYFIARWLTIDSLKRSSYLAPSLFVCSIVAFLINLIHTESPGRMHLRTHMRPEIAAIVEWIQKDTPENGRVLFEESGDESGFVYDGMYLSALIPHITGRQLIGGPINLYNDRHHFAEFHAGKLFKRDTHTLTDEEIRNYFRLYNIGAIVAFHPASLQKFQSLPGLIVLDKRIGPVHLMRVNQPLTWFIEGEGKVEASANRVQVLEAEGKEVTLKYHWTQGLAGSPALKIVPVQMYDDPIPFVKIINPPREFTLKIVPETSLRNGAALDVD